MSESTEPFFIVGCGRSGTTLLRAMLNQHSQIGIPLESLFILDYLRAPQSIPVEVLIHLLVHDQELAEWGITFSSADFVGCHTALDLMHRLHERYLAETGGTIWGQKTPRFVRHWRLLLNYFPDGRFLHVIRDPRAVSNSLMNSNLHRSNALFAAKRWQRDVASGLALKVEHPDRVIDVHYEALVLDTENTLRTICRFLGIEFETQMLNYYQTEEDMPSIFVQIHERVSAPPRPDRIESWRATMSARDIALIESITSDLMQTVGYNPLRPARSPGSVYVLWLKVERIFQLQIQILHRIFRRFGPLYSYAWRKLRLGLFWSDLREVNF